MAIEDDPKAKSADETNTSDKDKNAAPQEAAEEGAAVAPSAEAESGAEAQPAAEASTDTGADTAADTAAGTDTDTGGDTAAATIAEPSEAKEPETAAAPIPMPIKGARWAEPIAGFEKRWTWLEARLLTFVLMWQLLALVAWVLLSGVSAPPSTGDSSGTTFRCVIASLVLGIGAWIGARKLPMQKRQLLVIAGIILGVFIGLVLRPPHDATSGVRFALNRALGLDCFDAFLVNYFGNIKGWLQEGSTLTLMGGLRGLATRLTLWLALLGASLATAAGKHIHIDVIFRFLPKRLRVPAALINFTAAATVCFAGAWGFIDHLAIESFDSKADATAGAKIRQMAHHMGLHAFLTRKQIGLDIRSLPHVLSGDRYDQWMTPATWNEWVKEGGFDEKYKPEEVKAILVPEDAAPHPPLVIAPDGAATRGILIHDLNLVFPFGLIVIGLRFLLRALLTISGHIPVDPDAAHKEELPHGGSNEAVKEGSV